MGLFISKECREYRLIGRCCSLFVGVVFFGFGGFFREEGCVLGSRSYTYGCLFINVYRDFLDFVRFEGWVMFLL